MKDSIYMNKVRTLLQILYYGILAVVLLFVLLFETGFLEDGLLAAESARVEFVFLTVMELLTVACIPLALMLFKFKKVEAQLKQRHEEALQVWGVLRLFMLQGPLVVNTVFYYLFLNTSFGYMAIILFLSMAFIRPTKERCDVEAFITEDVQES